VIPCVPSREHLVEELSLPVVTQTILFVVTGLSSRWLAVDAGCHVIVLTIRVLAVDISPDNVFYCHNIKEPAQTFTWELYYYIISIIYEEVWHGIMGRTHTMAPQNVDAWRQTFAYSSTAYCLSDCEQFSYRKREIFVSIINFVCQLVDKSSEIYIE
jgi:hypothetical protein